MTNDNDDLAIKIEAIRQMFLQRLRDEWLPRLGKLRKRSAAAWTRTDFDEIAFLSHSMAGSGATFGYQAISDVGRKIEIAVRTLIRDDAASNAGLRAEIFSGLERLERESRSALKDLRR